MAIVEGDAAQAVDMFEHNPTKVLVYLGLVDRGFEAPNGVNVALPAE
jgi:hypothetical protein